MVENKTKPTSASVDDFIAAIENNRRRADTLTALEMRQVRESGGKETALVGVNPAQQGNIYRPH